MSVLSGCAAPVFVSRRCSLLVNLSLVDGIFVRCGWQDPKIYVQTILDIHKKYNMLVMTAFSNDSGFVESLDKVAPCLAFQ